MEDTPTNPETTGDSPEPTANRRSPEGTANEKAGETDGQPGQAFATTHWSLVLTAGESDSERTHAALEKLCRAYWPPLYAHIRHLGHTEETAKDLTQAFFARLLQRNDLAKADPRRGRFRNFLLKSFTRFLHDEWDKARAEKRGGKIAFVSFDDPDAAATLAEHPATNLTPAEYFERRWAMAVLEETWRCVRQDYDRRGEVALLEALRPYFSGDDSDATCSQLAARLGRTTEAVKSAVKRLRTRYRSTLREVVTQTVATPREVDEELRHLLASVAR